jgi:hypothetical protein
MLHRLLILTSVAAAALNAAEIRLGIVGTDTSHVIAFTKILNDPKNKDHVPGAKVVAAYKGGSKDVESSYARVDKYAAELQKDWGIEIVPDIATLCSKVDAVLLESVDGRPHLAQAKEIIKHKKPMFIDKPLASTLEDAREIARLAKAAGVPWFTASSLRWNEMTSTMKLPGTTAVITWGPGPTEPHHHLDLSWYGIHPIELMYALMGQGCTEVTRVESESGDVIVGKWKDGRIGTVRTNRPYGGYGAVVFQKDKLVQSPPNPKTGYQQMVGEIVKFFETKVPPVSNEESLEVFAFMDAALRSKQAGGAPTKLR